MLRLAHSFIAVALASALSLITGAASQRAAAGAPPQADIDVLVTRYQATAEEYHKVFLNLTAEETRLVEVFDQSGRLGKRREIVSDLVVYQPPQDSNGKTTEYRDVRSVDGKPITKRSGRALDLLRLASKSNSIKKELEMIDRESTRYDLNYRFSGLTDLSVVLLRDRQKFRIEWVGRDQVGGHEVAVLDYQEIAPNRDNPDKSIYEQYGFSASFTRGRLWLDVTTSQLRRERWEFTGIHPALPQPVTVMSVEATHTESRFGILVPERVEFDFYMPAKQKKNQPPAFFRSAHGTCTYREFQQFEVATQQTIGTPAPPRW